MKLYKLLPLFIAAMFIISCGDKEAPDEKEGTTGAEQEQPIEEETKVIAPEDRPETFTYVESFTYDMIPHASITGMANGQPIEIKDVVFQPGWETWQISLLDKELESPDAIKKADEHVEIELPEGKVLEAGAIIERPMAYGDGYFQIEKEPGETTSWNTQNAWVLHLTEWDVADYDPEGSYFQIGGKASGYIAVVYKGGGDIENSYVAGYFEDATVRYSGTPPWMEEEEEEDADTKTDTKTDAKTKTKTSPKSEKVDQY